MGSEIAAGFGLVAGDRYLSTAAGVEGDPVLAETLMAHCHEHLARFKCPREVRFRAELPRSEAGKVIKREIRRALEQAGM